MKKAIKYIPLEELYNAEQLENIDYIEVDNIFLQIFYRFTSLSY